MNSHWILRICVMSKIEELEDLKSYLQIAKALYNIQPACPNCSQISLCDTRESIICSSCGYKATGLAKHLLIEKDIRMTEGTWGKKKSVSEKLDVLFSNQKLLDNQIKKVKKSVTKNKRRISQLNSDVDDVEIDRYWDEENR